MEPVDLVNWLADNHAVVRFFRDDDAELVRVALPTPDGGRHLAVEPLEDNPAVALQRAVGRLIAEVEAVERRTALRAV